MSYNSCSFFLFGTVNKFVCPLSLFPPSQFPPQMTIIKTPVSTFRGKKMQKSNVENNGIDFF